MDKNYNKEQENNAVREVLLLALDVDTQQKSSFIKIDIQQTSKAFASPPSLLSNISFCFQDFHFIELV